MLFRSPTAAGVSVGGRVSDGNGYGVAYATVSLTSPDGQVRTALTNAFGYYQIDDVEAGSGYTIGATAKRYTFATRVINVSDSLTDVDFTP